MIIKSTCGKTFLLMNEPWAPIFVFSRTVFSELQVLIPGPEKVEMNTRPKLILCTCGSEKHYPRCGSRSGESTSCSSKFKKIYYIS